MRGIRGQKHFAVLPPSPISLLLETKMYHSLILCPSHPNRPSASSPGELFPSLVLLCAQGMLLEWRTRDMVNNVGQYLKSQIT